MTSKNSVLMEVRNIVKRFGATIAVNDVSVELRAGEVRGLIGENGSGKSTMSSIIAGMQPADSGTMLLEGQPWAPKTMIDALAHGVGMIVQESGTVPGITVAENIFLAETDRFRHSRRIFKTIDRKAMNRSADEALKGIGVTDINGATPVSSLDFQSRKLIEIAKVAMKKPKILVVDETTTALSHNGRTVLYDLIRRYREEGRAVVFISHDLDEIMEVCDTLSVLRDGRLVRNFEKAEFDADAIRTSMIGRQLQGDYYRSDYTPSAMDETALEAKNIRVPGELDNVSISVMKGEIVGIGGLSECGMHTLGKVLFGAVKPRTGTVTAGGCRITDESGAMEFGVGYIAKDRDVESLSMSASIRDNIAIAGMEKFCIKDHLIFGFKERDYVNRQIARLEIKCTDRNQQVSQLSGGNKQKVVFGKWIGRDSDVLIMDCPTRGVDIGVKQAMYQLMTELKAQGKSIIMISEELPELIGMCDRIEIMMDGRITKEFTRSESLTDAQIIQYMI